MGWEARDMRNAAIMAIVLGCGAASAAAAQSVATPATSAALAQAAFAPQVGGTDPIGEILDRHVRTPRAAQTSWRTHAYRLTPKAVDSGPVDSLRVSLGEPRRTLGGLPLTFDPAFDSAKAYEVSLVRNWPGAISFDNGKIGLDVSPHAGFGVSSSGNVAEAGATVRIGRSREDVAVERLRDMGVGDGSSFGLEGRWYLFAAASGRAVGLNMLRGEAGWDRAGWTTDPTGSLVGDAQIGVGWRKGPAQTSFGLIHREVKGQHMLFGQETHDDTMVAVSFTIRPGD
jgi:Uncharacterized protein conserved in bacteria (DUF2219)